MLLIGGGSCVGRLKNFLAEYTFMFNLPVLLLSLKKIHPENYLFIIEALKGIEFPFLRVS